MLREGTGGFSAARSPCAVAMEFYYIGSGSVSTLKIGNKPEDREFVAQAIQKMLTDHRSVDFTKRVVRPDGEIRHVRCVGTAATHDGTFGGFLGTGMDVTEQEELTKALRKSEEELRQMLDRRGRPLSWRFHRQLWIIGSKP